MPLSGTKIGKEGVHTEWAEVSWRLPAHLSYGVGGDEIRWIDVCRLRQLVDSRAHGLPPTGCLGVVALPVPWWGNAVGITWRTLGWVFRGRSPGGVTNGLCPHVEMCLGPAMAESAGSPNVCIGEGDARTHLTGQGDDDSVVQHLARCHVKLLGHGVPGLPEVLDHLKPGTGGDLADSRGATPVALMVDGAAAATWTR